MDAIEGKRIYLKRKVPNPLFQEWLEELYTEANAKKSKLKPMLHEALTSLSKYPMPLQSGAECAILKGFDSKLCLFLDKRLEVYNRQIAESGQIASRCETETSSNLPIPKNLISSANCFKKASITNIPENVNTQNNAPTDNANDITSISLKSKKARYEKLYKPMFRSGGYAILIALLEYSKENHGCIKKDELIEKAQQYSEESFTRPKPESFYTAWSNMSTLVKKGLVKQTRGKRAEYSLTEQGLLMATQLLEDSKNKITANDIIFNGASASHQAINLDRALNNNGSTVQSTVESDLITDTQKNTEGFVSLHMSAGSFDVILLIDKNETGGACKKNDPTVVQFKKYPDLKHEYRSLKVGDFTWIARHKINLGQEFVLPYVVERKRMDDLGASIKDGRFHEQKFRLRKCGLKNVIYLVENYGDNKHVGLPIQSLMQALANTMIQDGFKVHLTESLTDSARFLAIMTKRLTIEYMNKNLVGSNKEFQGETLMTFNFFNKSSIKNKPLTIKETFIKLLLQLKGVSVEKAVAVTKSYSTPKLLIQQYENCSQKEGEMLLANLKYGDLNRNVGPSVSKSIYQLFKS